jgi:hypothetical protein
VSHSFLNWASKKSSRENDLIWIQGTGAANTGSVLAILAQTGYTKEVHQIISLSRIASLIGRDSNGGLPELWDIMGRRKGMNGITRLMAICITRGSLSRQRALALIRDHNVNLSAKDDNGRTPIHIAFEKNLSKNIIKYLHDLYPNGLEINGRYGYLPTSIVNEPLTSEDKECLNKQSNNNNDSSKEDFIDKK